VTLVALAAWLSVSTGVIPASTGADWARAAGKSDSKGGGEQRIKQLESALERAVKHGQADAEADALYDLAKAYFEAGDLARAQELMRNSLTRETALNRPDAAIRTRVALATILVAAKRNEEAAAVYREAFNLASAGGKAQQA